MTLFLLLSILGAPGAHALSDGELATVRDGFEARRNAALRPMAGKPFRPAKKNAPLAPGRPAYVRGYAWSVTDFTMKSFLLNEQPGPANAALAEMCRYFSENRDVRNDYDNFYWSMDVVCRIVEFYGRAGSRAAGRLGEQAENAALEMMWLWAKEHSRLADAEIEKSRTWTVWGSENHHLQRLTTAWHFAKILKESPKYRDRKYDDGGTARQHYDAWTAYGKAYLRERAGKSLFVEIANDGYNTESLKGIYNFYDFAEDAELKRRAGLFLDLYWAAWAEEQLGGVRGGGKTRIYPGPGSLHGLYQGISGFAWYYFGLGRPTEPHGADYTVLTSAWRPAPVVIDLACDPAGRGEYEIRQWPLGLAEQGFSNTPEYHLRPAEGGILRYSWCTPDFIMGTLMFAARRPEEWAAISSQNRWQGVIFAGDPDARIFPQVRALSRNRAYNQHWAVQRKGTLITQKLRMAKGAGEMRVWISGRGIGNVVERGGWVFAEAAGAWAAVRPASGGWTWQAGQGSGEGHGRWLVPADAWTPVIIEAAGKKEFKGYDEFQAKVLGNRLEVIKGKVEYTGLGGDRFTFYTDYAQMPKINGEAVDTTAKASFDSPFIQSARDSGVVWIRKGGRELVLDFNVR